MSYSDPTGHRHRPGSGCSRRFSRDRVGPGCPERRGRKLSAAATSHAAATTTWTSPGPPTRRRLVSGLVFGDKSYIYKSLVADARAPKANGPVAARLVGLDRRGHGSPTPRYAESRTFHSAKRRRFSFLCRRVTASSRSSSGRPSRRQGARQAKGLPIHAQGWVPPPSPPCTRRQAIRGALEGNRRDTTGSGHVARPPSRSLATAGHRARRLSRTRQALDPRKRQEAPLAAPNLGRL